MMTRWSVVLVLLATTALLWSADGLQEPKYDPPRFQGAILLTGYYGRIITTTNDTWDVLANRAESFAQNPGLSPDGKIMVGALGREHASPPRLTLATYSLSRKKWNDYKDVSESGGVAISPDGAKLAFAVKEKIGAPYVLHLIDLKTGQETVGPEIGRFSPNGMSWSPDGHRIVFDTDIERSAFTLRPAIEVLDLESGKITKLADGRSPTWSPSGEWIAYLTYSADHENMGPGASLPNANQACLIAPDGGASKALVTLSGAGIPLWGADNIFMDPPVWSPDSKALLLNRLRNADKTTMDIYLLDLATLKMTRKFKNTAPVYGWAEAR